MTLRGTLKIAVLVATGACASQPTVTQKLFVYENFVGEGRPEYKTTAYQIELYKSPDSDSEITNRVNVSKGQLLNFDNAITRTLEAGRPELQGDVSIQVREFGEINVLPIDLYYNESITWIEKKISAGDKPELLLWMPEGNCLITIKQTVNETSDCPTGSGNHWKLTSQPVIENWIEINIDNLKGWVKVDDQQIKEVSRSF